MRRKLLDFIKKFSYSFSSNMAAMLISLIINLVIPKLVSVEQYGYYQLYAFYITYVGVSYLGLCDGIYLRIGGQYYDKLDKPLYSAQFRLLGVFEVIVYGFIFAGALFFNTDANRHYVIGCVCVAGIGMCLRWFITFILQATARIKEYAIVTITERILYVAIAVPLVLAGYRGFRILVFTDVAAKYVSLALGIWYCRDMISARPLSLKKVLPEVRENISSGFRFMLAQLSSVLIIGVVRFGVERQWDISTFSRVSVTLSVSNLVMTAINAVAVVIYPMLRRTNEERLPQFYRIIRVLLGTAAFFVLIFYYPVQRILSAWLPQYAESLRYAAILFPICVYESKMSMLVSSYYKTLRLEGLLMKCNMAALALSVVCTAVATLVLNSVTAAILSILVVLIFRCILCELVLTRKIRIEVTKDIVIELAMTVAFIVCNWFFGFYGMLAYIVFYLGYLALKRRDIRETVGFIKSMR